MPVKKSDNEEEEVPKEETPQTKPEPASEGAKTETPLTEEVEPASEKETSLPTETEEKAEEEQSSVSPPPPPTETPQAEEADSAEEEVAPDQRNKKMFAAGIVIAILVLGSTVALFSFRAKKSVEQATQVAGEQTEVTEPSPTPSPTPLPREEISLEILNGTNTKGLAAETAEIFEELGYQIVEIGNAENVEENQLYVNPEVEDLVDNLLEDVEEELEIASIAGELDDSTASARIILGE